ncbi:hypothetical protein IFM89_009733 [Coptis chinensis]|uniref:Uncharacterized protein n=1 Tax=Coptis chinensis TaxID=261450 RepID=A0A835HC70_9MAGN|nr:hypothetical protein IFM89_009733 [Coptis chinensis]
MCHDNENRLKFLTFVDCFHCRDLFNLLGCMLEPATYGGDEFSSARLKMETMFRLLAERRFIKAQASGLFISLSCFPSQCLQWENLLELYCQMLGWCCLLVSCINAYGALEYLAKGNTMLHGSIGGFGTRMAKRRVSREVEVLCQG